MELPSQIFRRDYFSINHLLAAALFTEKAGKIEQMWADGTALDQEEPYNPAEHPAYVASAIMLSAAFLEATINEFFSDCADKHSEIRKTLPSAELMGRLWVRNIPRTARYPIIEKYEIALEISGKEPLDNSTNPYQDTKLLIELRNALIHYEPENVLTSDSKPTAPTQVHKFEKKFRGKFPLNPLADVITVFYPEQMLGHGCALWALRTAVAFSDVFFASLDLVPRYNQIRIIVDNAVC